MSERRVDATTQYWFTPSTYFGFDIAQHVIVLHKIALLLVPPDDCGCIKRKE